ncbi:hypothetical protein BY996DRAFT_6417042 [Phakopsora pachyrhizi]|nr:hypothetical protein BY996DRAFT_6417042 [Phakopsora pachyrhizi]
MDEGITHDDKDGKNSKRCKGILKYGEKNTEGLVKQEKKKWEPKPELVQFLETANNAGKKIVYIGFCSVVEDMVKCSGTLVDRVNDSKKETTRTVSEAERLEEVLVDQSVDANKISNSSRCYYFNSVPHDWLFTKIHAACRHGGAGATGASLRVGIFTFIRPILAIDISDLEYAKSLVKQRAQTIIQVTAKTPNPSLNGFAIVMTKSDSPYQVLSSGKQTKSKPHQSNSYSTYSGVRGRSFSENLVSESNSVQLVSDDIRSASTGVLPSSTKPIRARAIKTQKFVVLQNQPLATAPALNTTNYKPVTEQSPPPPPSSLFRVVKIYDEDSSSWDILSHSKSEAAELSGSLKNLR